MTDQLKAPSNENTPAAGTAMLLEAMVRGSSDGLIEAQEARGQRSFVGSDTLPRDTGHTPIDWARLGIKLLGNVDGDDLFQYVELPAGWKKQATAHSMWSKLCDEQGRERASIFYKAAFYDRGAHMHLTTRFRVTSDYDLHRSENKAVALVKDGETVVHRTDPRECSKQYWDDMRAAESAARAWLAERFPDFESPYAYWEVPALPVAE